eukprot:m.1455601 g.1455601  ORF g.1455601 m.1455601 type:complete len:172 (+) comp25120_c0_seq52:746-1261(+)
MMFSVADAPRSWYQKVNGHDVCFFRKRDGVEDALEVSHQEFPMQVRLLLPHTENQGETISAYEPEWSDNDDDDVERHDAAHPTYASTGVERAAAVGESESDGQNKKRKRTTPGAADEVHAEFRVAQSRKVDSGSSQDEDIKRSLPSFEEVRATMMTDTPRNLTNCTYKAKK